MYALMESCTINMKIRRGLVLLHKPKTRFLQSGFLFWWKILKEVQDTLTTNIYTFQV